MKNIVMKLTTKENKKEINQPVFKSVGYRSNTRHFMCAVEDSINNYEKIGQVYYDCHTILQATKHFLKKDKWVKQFVGNPRYRIIMRENPIVLQDVE